MQEIDDIVDVLPKFLPGSIAEREHKKWFNAVEMPNNPYAPEALRRRISGDHEHYMDLPNIQSPMKDPHPLELLTSQNVLNDNDEEQNQRNKEYRRYSRDYYINNRHDFSSSTVLNDINVELPEQKHHHNCFLNNEKIPIGKEITEEQRQGNVTENVESEKSLLKTSINSPTTTTTTTTTTIQIADAAITNKSTDTNTNTGINTKLNTNTTIHNSHPNGDPDVYEATPVQVQMVMDDSLSSIDSMSSQISIKSESISTSSSGDTDTVRIYDFKKQETILIPKQCNYNNDDADSNNNNQDNTKNQDNHESKQEQERQDNVKDAIRSVKREWPNKLNLSNSSDSIRRGSTPTAFKFLQPKRKLINLNQILSVEEGELTLAASTSERSVIEKEVAKALPSVKTLARTFLLNLATSESSQVNTTPLETKKSLMPTTTKLQEKFSNNLISKILESSNPVDSNGVTKCDVINSNLSLLQTNCSRVIENTKEKQNSTIRKSLSADKVNNSSKPLYDNIGSGGSKNDDGCDGDHDNANSFKHNIAFFENLKFK